MGTFSEDDTKKEAIWTVSNDANPDARILADDHYSRKTKGATFFCGPGEKLVLLTPDKKALFVWCKNEYRQCARREEVARLLGYHYVHTDSIKNTQFEKQSNIVRILIWVKLECTRRKRK